MNDAVGLIPLMLTGSSGYSSGLGYSSFSNVLKSARENCANLKSKEPLSPIKALHTALR